MMTQYSGKVIRKTPVTPTQTSASGVWKQNEVAAAVQTNTWPIAGVPNPISRSVRLRSSASAYFNRTFTTPTNNKIWTFSFWIKRGVLSTPTQIFASRPTASPYALIYFNTDNTLQYDDNGNQLFTTQVFRDTSAWYHIMYSVDTTQATASNRIKLYVNGSQVTAFGTSTYPTQNYNTQINSASSHALGKGGVYTNEYLDGYLTEINFIDGQALTPSSFGTTDSLTGVWIPMPYTGTYGTNGFYVNFKDNTDTTTIGYDYSGNSNNWTANNISLTAGTTYDSMLDVPTLWQGYNTGDPNTATRGNYCVLNPIAPGDYFVSGQTAITLTNGNLSYGTGGRNAFGTIAVSSGKFYWEISNTANTATAVPLLGLVTVAARASVYGAYYQPNGNKGLGVLNTGATETAYGATWTDNDVIGVALDMDAATPTVTFYKNNSSQGAISVSSFVGQTVMAWVQNGANSGNMSGWFNFGQRPFSYTPPTGFKSLNTYNLPAPTITNGANYMAATTYTGTGSNLTVSNAVNGVSFKPDYVWIKSRSAATNNRNYDSVRGNFYLVSNSTAAEVASGTMAIQSNGFLVGTDSDINTNAATYVGWQWQAGQGTNVSNTSGSITSTVSANTTAGFSVVTYTGTGANATVGHGLGVAPSFIIIKARNAVDGWIVYHSAVGATQYLILNTTAAAATSASPWQNTAPSSTVITLGTASNSNANGQTAVAYCWAAVAGYSAFGSYTGNGSTDGPFVYCGFRPRWVLWKRSDSTGDWILQDTSRSTYNASDTVLYPNLSAAESVGGGYPFDILSNGFKMRTSATYANASGGTYIYAAFAENPFRISNAR